MDNLDSNQPGQASISELQQECDGLRQLLVSVMVLMIVLSGAINIFLLRQLKYARQDLQAYRPQAVQLMNDYNRAIGPMIVKFGQRMAEFGAHNPKFVPILTKYGIRPASGPAPSAPAAGGAVPAATPPPAKK